MKKALEASRMIRIDGGTQPRMVIRTDVVGEYANQIEDGRELPPVIVFYDGSEYWLADGFHRHHARAFCLGQARIECDVRKGTQRDAILYSCGANSEHGLRRTNEDKRRAVMVLLNDTKWAKWSDAEIARRCSVSQPMVSELRASQSNSGYKIRRKQRNDSTLREVKRGDSIFLMDTSRIGRTTKHKRQRCPHCGQSLPQKK